MNLIRQILFLPAFMKDPPQWSRGQCWLVLEIAKADAAGDGQKLKNLREVAEGMKAEDEGLGDWLLTTLDLPVEARASFARWAWLIVPRAFWAIKVAGLALWLRRLSDNALKKARDLQDDYAGGREAAAD